ncbi:hypothetical protein Q73A0000_13900 [Kaistella flava (ex Peng et al. 2021)]|uniref:Uncharacterized protein n=1 Tax=Kaistella flava (ex Peng et al. 2021) TaxID=2038776 RepID=A0A7M2YB76_9FLAO|nr:hypothetical protein [Kaistella flava (ex Peng et al. 2021)]QOW11376.1 hypothetical protein Q73A0000_13900 [Kaistella flava (ex Peng et al. 2021)]
MIDFIKIKYTDTGYVLPISSIDFKSGFNHNTGELDETVKGNYFDFNIERWASGRTIITGSIHKYFNRNDFNGNDFTALNFQTSVINLKNEIHLVPDLCKLENVEIGVNIQTEFNPNLLLENLLFHRTKEFNKPIAGAYYMQSKKENYIIKIYNKSAQNNRVLRRLESELKGSKITPTERAQKHSLAQLIKDELKPNTLRFEIKFLKMEVLNQMGIITLADLCKPEFFQHFKEMLMMEFDEVYFYDYTTDNLKMRTPEQIKFKDYRNPNYWKSLDRKDKYYHKKRFADLTLKYSQNIKGKVSELIGDKMEELTAKSLDIFPDILAPHQTTKFRQIPHSYIGVKCPNNSNDLAVINEGVNAPENNTYCKVTGLNISMQKKGSLYLCSTGLKFYKKNDPDIFRKLYVKYLSDKMKTRPIEKQIYYIAHNIRNTKTNPYHNTRNNRVKFEQRNYNQYQLQIVWDF